MALTEEQRAELEAEVATLQDQARRLARGEAALEIASRAAEVDIGAASWMIRYELLKLAQSIAPEGIRERIVIEPSLQALADTVLPLMRKVGQETKNAAN